MSDWHCKQIPNGQQPIVVCERETLTAEIERLRAEVGRLRNSVDTLTNMLSEQCDMSDRYALAANKAEAEIERLWAAGDEMADAATRQQWSRLDVAVAAWQEARRG